MGDGACGGQFLVFGTGRAHEVHLKVQGGKSGASGCDRLDRRPLALFASRAMTPPKTVPSSCSRPGCTGSENTARPSPASISRMPAYPYLSAALGEIALNAGRSQSFPGAKYRRLIKRMPKKKALVAIGNSVLTIFHALLFDPAATYHDLGPDYYQQHLNIHRQARNHLRNLERLGYKVTIQPLTTT